MSQNLRLPVVLILIAGVVAAVLFLWPTEPAGAPEAASSSQTEAVQTANAGPAVSPAGVAGGFQDRLYADVPGATALAFLPDDRLLATDRRGAVRLHGPGADSTSAQEVLDISGRVCSNSERGLLGLAVDPDFRANGHIYLYYTFNKFGSCPVQEPEQNNPVNRVSRFKIDGGAVVAGSEKVLVDNIPSPNGNHNAGDLHFGNDGKLYVSVGDGSCSYLAPNNCQTENEISRYRHVLNGKILRLNTDGTIPLDNPYADNPNGVRCGQLNVNNAAGGSAARRDQVCQETYAYGFRNPFRFAVDPDAAGVVLRANDVGGRRVEEVSQVRSGGDYGWNCREGSLVLNTTSPCPGGEMLAPIHEYHHASGCSSITGGAFVPNNAGWPSSYRDAYLYGDYVCGRIYALTPDGNGGFDRALFASGMQGGPVSFAFGPGGDLFYTTYAGGGQVRRVAFTDNRAPVADVGATPSDPEGRTYGPTPLNVAFDASGSTDDEGDALTYEWDFGDPGSANNTATGAAAEHTYQTAGKHTASVTVSDDAGNSDSATVDVFAGNAGPPRPLIESVTVGGETKNTFEVGQQISLSGSATEDPENPVTLRWDVIRHHTAPNTHTHTYDEFTGPEASFAAPGPEDLGSTGPSGNYLEVRLTATDSQGLSETVSKDLRPETTRVRFGTGPVGLYLTVNGERVRGPSTLLAWENSRLNAYAPPQTNAGKSYVWRSWSDGGPNRRAITTPENDAGYTARFRPR